MPLQLGQDWVDRLNALYTDGTRFLKVVELTESPGSVSYWVDNPEPIVFNGNTYTPLAMRWENIKTSQSMTIEGWNIAISNLSGQAVRYLKQFDPSGCPVWMRLLHTKLLASATVHWKRYGKILSVRGTPAAVQFTIGRQLGRNMQPNELFLQSEFPSLTSEIPKIL